ncbi:MAG: hypothetical protein LCH88_22740 [Proteobacteria bacterium]|nr:hypothetical protein [Pseudomonadota bacterium]
MTDDRTRSDRPATPEQVNRAALWASLRERIVFVGIATVALSGVMAVSTGEWRLALFIGAALLAFVTAVGLATRRFLTGR